MDRLKSVTPTTTQAALLGGLLVGILIFGILFARNPMTGIWRWTTGWAFYYFLAVISVIGIPVTLFLRFGLLAPVVVLLMIFVFWGIPESDGYFIAVFFFWQFYLGVYLLLTVTEYVLRTRGILPPLPITDLP